MINNKSVKIGNIHFIFSTLWTHIRQDKIYFISKSIPDFQNINYKDTVFNPLINKELNHKAINFIKQELIDVQRVKIVITHHAPSLHCANDEYDATSLYDAYYNDLDYLIQNNKLIGYMVIHTLTKKFLLVIPLLYPIK